MAEPNIEKKRGFTTAEKWIIWGVFCLLVGLSTTRFTVFAGMLLLSAGIVMIIKKQKIGLAVFLSLAGLCSVIFSKFLF